MTAMTGTGFGDIFARGVLSRLVASVEMLVSILYTCVIMGMGMLYLCEQMDHKATQELQAKGQRLQKLLKRVAAAHSAQASGVPSIVGSPAVSAASSGAIHEPPLLELMHHPELLRELDEPTSDTPRARQLRQQQEEQPSPTDSDEGMLLRTA